MSAFTTEDIRLAQKVQSEYGIPASVTLAQYALESGYGTSRLAKANNNFFGMRNGASGWRTFRDKEESFMAYGKLMSGDRYKTLTAGATTIEGYVNAFSETYAPSSDGNENYAGKVLQIIRTNNLTQYDTGSLGGLSTDTGKESWLDNLGYKILSGSIKVVAVLFIVVFAVVLLLNAFDFSLSDTVKKKVKAA